jgi:hypothetical protein
VFVPERKRGRTALSIDMEKNDDRTGGSNENALGRPLCSHGKPACVCGGAVMSHHVKKCYLARYNQRMPAAYKSAILSHPNQNMAGTAPAFTGRQSWLPSKRMLQPPRPS